MRESKKLLAQQQQTTSPLQLIKRVTTNKKKIKMHKKMGRKMEKRMVKIKKKVPTKNLIKHGLKVTKMRKRKKKRKRKRKSRQQTCPSWTIYCVQLNARSSYLIRSKRAEKSEFLFLLPTAVTSWSSVVLLTF